MPYLSLILNSTLGLVFSFRLLDTGLGMPYLSLTLLLVVGGGGGILPSLPSLLGGPLGLSKLAVALALAGFLLFGVGFLGKRGGGLPGLHFLLGGLDKFLGFRLPILFADALLLALLSKGLGGPLGLSELAVALALAGFLGAGMPYLSLILNSTLGLVFRFRL